MKIPDFFCTHRPSQVNEYLFIYCLHKYKNYDSTCKKKDAPSFAGKCGNKLIFEMVISNKHKTKTINMESGGDDSSCSLLLRATALGY